MVHLKITCRHNNSCVNFCTLLSDNNNDNNKILFIFGPKQKCEHLSRPAKNAHKYSYVCTNLNKTKKKVHNVRL